MSDDLPPPNTETYLGDGLYASFDGWQIVLRAPRSDGTNTWDHWVGMEPNVYRALVSWIESHPRLKQHLEGG
jgi:hypothetical protein